MTIHNHLIVKTGMIVCGYISHDCKFVMTCDYKLSKYDYKMITHSHSFSCLLLVAPDNMTRPILVI